MKTKVSSPRTGLWIIIYMLVFSFSQQVALALMVDAQTPFVLAMSALIGLPILFLLLECVKSNGTIWFFKKIKFRKLFYLFCLGIVLNQVAGWLLYLLQLIPFLKDWFTAYQESIAIMSPKGDARQLIILLGIIVPIYEEVLFRGLVFREFAATIPIRWALVAQALLFGVWHTTLIQGAYAFLLALVLGRIYMRYQSIWASCAIHCGFNTASYLLTYLLLK